MTSHRVLFAGRTTLDVMYSLDQFPAEDTKVFARAMRAAPGGPATNAAITHALLGGRAVLMAAIGTGPWAAGVRGELDRLEIDVIDLAAGTAYETPLTTVLVNEQGATRTIVNPPRGGGGAKTGGSVERGVGCSAQPRADGWIPFARNTATALRVESRRRANLSRWRKLEAGNGSVGSPSERGDLQRAFCGAGTVCRRDHPLVCGNGCTLRRDHARRQNHSGMGSGQKLRDRDQGGRGGGYAGRGGRSARGVLLSFCTNGRL